MSYDRNIGENLDIGRIPAFVIDNSGFGLPKYMKLGSDSTGSAYPLTGYEFTKFDAAKRWFNGATIPGYVFLSPTGSSADVLCTGVFENGTWTVELRRQRETGNGDDAIF